ncbi:MAG: hypothetical protein IMF12_05360 [Proteobacteria bacterium]|nr:hypothetical protein [Pseudomonadota bacterium]
MSITCITLPKTKSKPLNKQQKNHNHNLSSQCILVENVIRKLKFFRLLKERKLFALRFNLIASIYNMELNFIS